MKEYVTKRAKNYQFKESKDLVLTILSFKEFRERRNGLEIGRKDEQRTQT